MEKVSIIIPAYNCEYKIKRTIDTIKKQTNNFEAIIVNDGSTDNTEKVIIENIKNDNRFRYIYINNSGVSCARNVGLKNAVGDYILFIDSDDYIEYDYLKNVINDMKNFDMIFYGYNTIINNKIIKHCLNNSKINDISKLSFFETLAKNNLFNPVCNKIIRRDLIGNTTFKENFDLGEDFVFFVELFNKCKTYKFYNKSFYNYDLTSDGLGFKKRKDIFYLKVNIVNELSKFYEGNNFNKKYLNNLLVNAYLDGILTLFINKEYSKAENRKIYGIISQKIQFKDGMSFKYRILLLIFTSCHTFTLKCICVLMNCFKKIVKKIKFGF